MANNKTIGEMVRDIQTAPDESTQISLLKKYDSRQLREVFRMNFDPAIKFALKPGPYEFRVRPFEIKTHLLPEWRRFKRLFLVGGHPTLTNERRDVEFSGLLSCLEHVEVEFVQELKDKALKNIEMKTVEAAYPGLFDHLKDASA